MSGLARVELSWRSWPNPSCVRAEEGPELNRLRLTWRGSDRRRIIGDALRAVADWLTHWLTRVAEPARG